MFPKRDYIVEAAYWIEAQQLQVCFFSCIEILKFNIIHIRANECT
jgi:hypothetical protein